MPQYNPTIIAAHFDDTELQNSISKLVSFVDAQTKAIEQSFDTAVTNIKNRWGELGNMKVDLGAIASNATNTTSRVRKSNVDTIKQETQAIREQTLTLDQQAQAMQRVTAPKSARESYLAFMQGYKEQANQIGNNISALERGLQQSIERRVQELRTLLQNAESRLAGFHPQTLIAGNDTWNRAITAARQEVERLKGEIERVPQAFTKQQSIIDELRAKREAILNIMREEPRIQQQVTESIRQTTSAAQAQIEPTQRVVNNLNAQVEAQAAILRQRMAQNKSEWIDVGGRTIFKDDGRLTIEEQLSRLVKDRGADFNLQLAVSQAITEEEKKQTQEIEKQRRAYTKPETWQGIDVSRSSIAQIISTKTGQTAIGYDEQSSSIKRLESALKQYQAAYIQMSDTERKSPFGRQMISDMQTLEYNIQKLRREMSRPIDFAAIKNRPEKTLDDIANKMRQLYSYRSGLDVETQKGEILSVNKEYDRLKKKMDEVMQKNTSLMGSNNALARSWNYMKNRLAFYFTVGASASFAKQLVEVRGQYELLERSIGILIDSAQNGSRIFAELNAMAIKSPFTTMELGAAAKQLVAYDVAAKDVVDTTRRLADMAAAVGIPMERLTYALGQIKAYGYLNARDARMFANAGIPLVQELADHYTRLEGQLVSTADIYDRIKKKAIDYTDVMQVVNSMTDEGGRFFNFQEKAADTLKVRIANLTLAWNNMLNEIGKDGQGVISTGLGAAKTVFENWRSIINVIQATALSIGVLKTVEITYHALADKALRRHAKGWMAFQLSMRKDLGVNIATKILNVFNSIGSSLAGLANPATLAKIAIAGISIALMKAYLDYRDLQKANEEFNKSIAKNAEENIQSIDKFFDDYKKKFSELGALDNVEQQKLWERTQEEIEKTVKASQQYIDVLNTISDASKRISSGQAILEQTKVIEGEVRRLSERGVFNIGGGFANDSAAKDLEQYSNIVNKIIREYGSLEKASGSLTSDITYKMGQVAIESRGIFNDYQKSLIDANKELADFVSLLDKGDLSRIMGDDPSMRIANIREYASIIRDSFLSTEQGQKITSEGQALLNHAIDEWVTKTALAGRMFKQIGDDNNKYTETQQANIEANRTAWENFFSQLSESERKRLDYLIKANQTGSDDFRELWDKATNRLKENATTAYNLIANQIAELRNTPAIVIDIVYRQREEKSLDEQINQFRKKYIEPETPANLSFASVDEYFNKVEENTKKYGRFIKKEGEDNVEWEKRLGETYQNNEKNIKSLTSQLQKSANMSDVDKKAKQGELDVLRQQQQVLKELERDQGFSFAQFGKSVGKGGSNKDVLGDALAEEVKLISDIQKRYREYRTMGVSATDALDKAAKEYGKTIMNNNAILQRFGLQTLTSSQIATSSYQSIRDFYQSQIKLAQAAGNTKGVEALEKAIANLNIEITKIDYKKITDGLNNELSKLKEEYELAVELDANPELGEAFSSMFDINPDELPHNIDEYAKRTLKALNRAFAKSEDKFRLPTLDLTRDDIAAFKAQVDEGLMSEATFNAIKKSYEEIRALRKKDTEDTIRKARELQYKLADVNDKIAIENEKLQHLIRQRDKETNDDKRLLLDLQIQDQRNTIARLGDEVLQLLPTYKSLFNSISEHSARVTRQIAEQWKKALQSAVRNLDGTYTIIDPQSGKTATITAKQYGNEIDKVDKKLRETATSFEKIRASFTKDEDGVVDWAQGLSYISDEAQKAADGLHTVADIITEIFGEKADGVAEVLNDVASTLEGMEAMAKGVVQFASGDYIGGTVGIIKGAWQAIGSWLDNADKRITKLIQKSQREVKKLEVAYAQLEWEVGRAMGASETGARRAALENKKLQLVELERQLQLEQSRKGKKRDEETILDLQGRVDDAKRSIQDSADEIASTLFGSDIKSAAEDFVDTWVEAWKAGETTLDAIEKKMDDVVMNIVKKAAASKIVSTLLQPFYNSIDAMTQEGSEGGVALTVDELRRLSLMADEQAIKINEALGAFFGNLQTLGVLSQSTTPQLSALQAGIQGITEETAGALEAYINGVSQQVYLHTDLLTQIRDILVGYEMDVQMGTMGQVLLQLQQSYQIQTSIHNILQGVLAPAGNAFNVELIS